MSVDFQRDGSWLDSLPLDLKLQSEIAILAGEDGYCIPVPKQFLLAKSELIRSILSDMCKCQVSRSDVCISVPFASSFSLKLTVEILTKGESSMITGLTETISNIHEVKAILQTLGVVINIGPKLITSTTAKFTRESIQKEDEHTLTKLRDDLDDIFREHCFNEQTKWNYVARKLIFDEYKGLNLTARLGERLLYKHNEELLSLEKDQNFVFKKQLLDSSTVSPQHWSHDNLEDNTRKKSDCFKCEFCRKTFSSRRSLVRHLEMKTCLEPLLKCPNCRMRFRSNVSMNEHINKVHGNEVVNNSNQTKDDYDISEENTKLKSDSFKCEFCMYIFSSKKTLNEHLKKKTCLEPLLKCPSCRLRYRSKDILNEHISRVHGRDEVNNNDYYFLEPNNTKPFEIEENSNSYLREKRGSIAIRAEQLEVPIIRDVHESNNPEESLISELGDELCPIDTPVKITSENDSDRVNSMISKFNGMWHCKICWMGFTLENKSSLKDHLLTRHTNTKKDSSC